MKRIVILAITLILILLMSGCGADKSQMPTLPAEGPIIEMQTKTMLAGVARHLTISADGSIVYIEERGLRHLKPGDEPIRITKTGQLQEDELKRLLELVDACPFDAEGNCNARTELIKTDATSELSIHCQGKTRAIVADYQPLFHLFFPDTPELSDVPESVRKLYQELRHIIDNRTTEQPPVKPTGFSSIFND